MDSKRIAALAGVLNYLQAERDKQRYLEERLVRPYSMLNRWSMYGRRTIMQLRNRAQRRILDNHLALSFAKEGAWYRGHCPLRARNLVAPHDRLLNQGRTRSSRP